MEVTRALYGPDHQRCSSAKDFRKAIEELMVTFPIHGVVSGDLEVLGPYGFSENGYYPGIFPPSMKWEYSSLKPHRGREPGIYRRCGKGCQDSGQIL